jgi:hypothetical protein
MSFINLFSDKREGAPYASVVLTAKMQTRSDRSVWRVFDGEANGSGNENFGAD